MNELRRLYRLLTARYLVSVYWGGIQTHPARNVHEALAWADCYPQVPCTIAKRAGLFSFTMYLQLGRKTS